MRIRFGMYRGLEVSELPLSYLKWMVKELRDGPFDNLSAEAERILRNPLLLAEEQGRDLSHEADDILWRNGFDRNGTRPATSEEQASPDDDDTEEARP